MTRFEKLKTMTVEEVAEWWWENIPCGACPFRYKCIAPYSNDTVNCVEAMKIILNADTEPENEVCSSCAIDYHQEEMEVEENV